MLMGLWSSDRILVTGLPIQGPCTRETASRVKRQVVISY